MIRSGSLKYLDGDARAFGLGFLILLPIYLVPLLVTRYLPGLDLPFHLSMVDMLNKQATATSPYRDYYAGGLSIAPYAAHYMALRLLSFFMPLMTAHKLTIALYIASFPLSLAALLNAAGRSRIPALLAFPLAYNLTLHYGFVSFAVSLPVMFLLLACLTRFLTSWEPNPWWWAATALAAVALFLCHLQNFLFGICASGAFILFAGVRWPRRFLSLSCFVPALACLVRWHVSREFEGASGAEKKSFAYAWQALKYERLADLGNLSIFHENWLRLRELRLHVLRGFTDNVDVTACEALLVVLAGYFLLGLVGLRSAGWSGTRPKMRVAGWIALAGALIAYLGLPHHLREFELMTFYPRFAVLVMALALLAIPGGLRRLDGGMRLLVLFPGLILGAFYGQELIRHYRYYDAEVADFSDVVAKVPAGGRALGLVFDRSSRVMRVESALVGMPNLYPVLRPSPTALVPVHYCGMRHMPCYSPPSSKPIPAPGPWTPAYVNAKEAIDFFDYFFVRSPPHRPIFGDGIKRLQIVAQSGSWIVYGRKPGQAPISTPPKAVAAPKTPAPAKTPAAPKPNPAK